MLGIRYRLEGPIAAGGVGRVWRARDLLLERPVAVKVLRPQFADHLETLARFRAEARHAGALTHPCIAQVYDYCDGGPQDSPYLVMELVDGPSLADMLEAGTIDAAHAMDIVAQVAAGLAAAHRIGLVHRDIKPANILIGSDGLVKITDFGIAHAAGSAPITAPELVMGTAHYLAPERITGDHDGPSGDLYSLGIVLYECLAGRPPFDGTMAKVMSAHLHAPLPPLPSDVPPAIGELLARLTTKDPAVRLTDAAEVAAVARRLSATLATGPSRPPVERAGIAEATLSADPIPNAEHPRQTRNEARPSRRRRRLIMTAATATAGLAAVIGCLGSGALRLTATPGQAAPGHGIQRHVTPSHSAAGKSGQPGDRNTAPSPSPSPRANAASGRNHSPRRSTGTAQVTHPPRATGGTTAGPAAARTTPTHSGSATATPGSGVQIQLSPLPSVGVSLGL